MLLWAPPYESDAISDANGTAQRLGYAQPIAAYSTDFAGLQWADVSFWIRPDGRTADAGVLRSSGSVPWAGRVLNQIARRRYAPRPEKTDNDAMQPGIYRVERVTLRSRYQTPSGSLVSRRVASGGFEVLDLTGGAAKRATSH